MAEKSPVMDLLEHGVPLALLIDLAGFGGSSEELYRTEAGRTVAPADAHLVAVAS